MEGEQVFGTQRKCYSRVYYENGTDGVSTIGVL